MNIDRKQESVLRLETLGHLSDQYSDIANMSGRPAAGPAEPDSQWEADSDSSTASTTAVLSLKGPPPGFRGRSYTFSEDTRSGSSDGRPAMHDTVKLSPKKPYVLHSDATQSGPMRALYPSRHPTTLRPGASAQYTNSVDSLGPDEQYRVENSHTGRQHRTTAPSICFTGTSSGNSCSTQIGPYPPSVLYGSERVGNYYNDERAPRHFNVQREPPSQPATLTDRASYLAAARSPYEDPVINANQPSRFQQRHPSSRVTTYIDGVEFEMISPPIFAPVRASNPARVPAPVPTTSPSSSRGRSQQTPGPAHPRSRSPSPAYGAWVSDRPRQKCGSFLDRAQARLERSIHEHLVKAGRRPLPSFEVLNVEKPSTRDVRSSENEEMKTTPIPTPTPTLDSTPNTTAISSPSTEAHWLERMEKLLKSCELTQASNREREKESWRLSSEDEAEAEVFSKEHQFQGSSPPPPTTTLDAANNLPSMRLTGHSVVRTDAGYRNFSLPSGSGASSGSDAPKSPSFSFNGGNNEKGEAIKPTSVRNSNDSLFLGNKSDRHHPAGYSFFSSEYTQRRIAAGMVDDEVENRRIQQRRQQQHPSTEPLRTLPAQQLRHRAKSSAAPVRRREEEEETVPHRTQPPVQLSREQLGFAALPSPLEDLGCPFPFDDRYTLPSRAGCDGKTKPLLAEHATQP